VSPLYLGLDCSTQSLTAVAIDAERAEIVFRSSLDFDAAFPEFGTTHGVLPSADPTVVHAPPALWTRALDRLLSTLVSQLDVSRLAAISGAAQQHGSVCCTTHAGPLADGHFDAALTRRTAPTWMDASTIRECTEIEAALGGDRALASLTGSRAFPRFTGPQIRKFWRGNPRAYATTGRIHLVSSWLASALIGDHAPIDHADGSGMNLMDIRAGEWALAALHATAPALGAKLPALVPSAHVAGRLSEYWRARYGLPPARIVAWSGDNPSSLIGIGLVAEGQMGISLGTSDTIFGPMDDVRISADGTGHVFASPTGAWMGITVFRNGSLARERVRDRFGLDWNGFSEALRHTPPGNGGAMLLPWFEPEITPPVAAPSPHAFNLRADDAATHVRAVVEGQMLALARHSEWMGVRPRQIRATGGAAANAAILQIMADVFDADVMQFEAQDSAALGAAIRAWHADAAASGHLVSWRDATEAFIRPAAAAVFRPEPSHGAIYRDMRRMHAQRERAALLEQPSGGKPR
jgi:xylulokinase